MYRVVIIKADGTVQTTLQKKPPVYNSIKAAVGGYMETIPYFTKYEDLKRGRAYCNEEGKLIGLPFNERATLAWMTCCPKGDPSRMQLNGDVIFYAKDNSNGV